MDIFIDGFLINILIYIFNYLTIVRLLGWLLTLTWFFIWIIGLFFIDHVIILIGCINDFHLEFLAIWSCFGFGFCLNDVVNGVNCESISPCCELLQLIDGPVVYGNIYIQIAEYRELSALLYEHLRSLAFSVSFLDRVYYLLDIPIPSWTSCSGHLQVGLTHQILI